MGRWKTQEEIDENAITLGELLEKPGMEGKTIQVGCQNGSGIVLCGVINNELRKKAKKWPETPLKKDGTPRKGAGRITKFASRKVVWAEPGIYSDLRVNIEGKGEGDEELPIELCKKYDPDLIPLERYMDMAGQIAASSVTSLRKSIADRILRTSKIERDRADDEIAACEKFLKSDSFTTIMRNADGETVVNMTHDLAEQDIVYAAIAHGDMDSVREIRKMDDRLIKLFESFPPGVLRILAMGGRTVGEAVKSTSDKNVNEAYRRYSSDMAKERELKAKKASKEAEKATEETEAKEETED